MGLFSKKKFMPTRMSASNDYDVISNIDDILDKPIAFVLHGKAHQINPVTTREFLEWSKALAGLSALRDKKHNDEKELIEAHLLTINTLCPSITKEDLETATQAQIAAIYGILLDHVSGKAHTEDYKKKTIEASMLSEKSLSSKSAHPDS